MKHEVICPVCEESWDEPCDYQAAEPDVGILSGGVLLGEIHCPSCGHIFSEDEIQRAERRIDDRMLGWSPAED